MRIIDGFCLIALATHADDGIWPAQSPTPSPKFCEGRQPDSDKACICEQQGFRVGKMCYNDVPCEHQARSARSSLCAQKSKMVHSPMPKITERPQTRRQKHEARVRSWVLAVLEDMECAAALATLGADVPVSIEDYNALADDLWRRYQARFFD